MKKLIKKYQTGGPTRLYNYQPLPSKDKWNGVTSIKDLEGNELNPGDLVMATPEGKMTTTDNTLAYLDYMAANNIPILGPTLNLLTVTHNNQTGKTTTSLGEDFEDRLKRLQQDPIANDSLLRLLWLELGELLWNLSHDKHTIDTKLADKIANARTPEALSIMSPALLGIAAILGFESATAMAAWAAAYPEAFAGIVGSTLGGEIINLATNLGSGGQYSDWGDYANQTWGHGDKSSDLEKFLWGATNVGYFVNPLSRGTSAIKLAENSALNGTLASIDGPWAQRALNVANKYNLGEGVKAGIYNTNLSLLYGPEVAAKAGLNHLKLGVLDLGWYTKNLFTKNAKNAWKDMFKNYLLVRFNPKAFKPSDRSLAEQLFNIVLSTSNYVRKGTSPNFVIKGIGYAKYSPQRWQRTPYVFSYPVKDHYNYTFQFLEPNVLKQRLVNEFYIHDSSEVESILNGTAGKFLEGPLKDLLYTITVGGLTDIHNPNKVLSAEAQEINATLGDLGHVLGSQVTVLNPYATHTPKDIDIITTQRNLPEVIRRLKLTNILNNGWHAKGTSSKYGDIDILVIQNSANGSKGRVAFLTYAKMDPRAYNKMIRSGVYEVPLTPEELLKVHRDNVLHFSNLDALVSGSLKHAERVRQLLLTPDRKLIRLAINDLENIYRAHLGDSFSPLESLGVYINYADTAANTEFLKKFGLENTAYLAESPDKMEFLIKYILYRTHMANRVVEKTPTMDAMDVVKAILTNASYSNYGGNATAGKFGGGLGYGGGDPYVGNIQYPINHPWKLKNAMDVYNYLGKMVDVEEPLRYSQLHSFVPYELILNFNNDFPISTDVSSLLQNTLHFLELLTGNEKLYDILHHIVPNRNPNLGINNVISNPLQREALSNVNNKVGKTLDITHIYSFLPGFNNEFIGKLQKYVPNIGYNIVRSSDANGTYFNGFELPRISLNFPAGRKLRVIPNGHLVNLRLYENKAISNGMRNASSKVNNALLILTDATKDIGSLYNNPQYTISRTKDWAKAGSLTGAGLGLLAFPTIYTLNQPSMKFRREIWYNVPYDLYGKTPKQVQEELSKIGIIIDDNDLWQLNGWKTEKDFYGALETLLAAKYDK